MDAGASRGDLPCRACREPPGPGQRAEPPARGRSLSTARHTSKIRVMKRFAGVYTPIVTPFTADDVLDEKGLRNNVARWMTTPLTGLVVLGSNGEAPQLEDNEADRAIEIVRAGMPKDRPLIAGTGRESTKATIAATSRAAALGADAA